MSAVLPLEAPQAPPINRFVSAVKKWGLKIKSTSEQRAEDPSQTHVVELAENGLGSLALLQAEYNIGTDEMRTALPGLIKITLERSRYPEQPKVEEPRAGLILQDSFYIDFLCSIWAIKNIPTELHCRPRFLNRINGIEHPLYHSRLFTDTDRANIDNLPAAPHALEIHYLPNNTLTWDEIVAAREARGLTA